MKSRPGSLPIDSSTGRSGGPYRLWIHEHRFRDSEHGAICEDTVRYAVWGGAVVNWLGVERDVKRIFDYRREKLLEVFSPGGDPPS